MVATAFLRVAEAAFRHLSVRAPILRHHRHQSLLGDAIACPRLGKEEAEAVFLRAVAIASLQVVAAVSHRLFVRVPNLRHRLRRRRHHHHHRCLLQDGAAVCRWTEAEAAFLRPDVPAPGVQAHRHRRRRCRPRHHCHRRRPLGHRRRYHRPEAC